MGIDTEMNQIRENFTFNVFCVRFLHVAQFVWKNQFVCYSTDLLKFWFEQKFVYSEYFSRNFELPTSFSLIWTFNPLLMSVVHFV